MSNVWRDKKRQDRYSRVSLSKEKRYVCKLLTEHFGHSLLNGRFESQMTTTVTSWRRVRAAHL